MDYQKSVTTNSAYKKFETDLFTNMALVGMDAVKDGKTLVSNISKLENTKSMKAFEQKVFQEVGLETFGLGLKYMKP